MGLDISSSRTVGSLPGSWCPAFEDHESWGIHGDDGLPEIWASPHGSRPWRVADHFRPSNQLN